MPSTEIRVSEPLADGEVVGLDESGRHILLCRVAGSYYATSNICSHARVLLSEGRLRGNIITCPLHGARFDVTTGKCLGGPAFQDIASYPVTEDETGVVISTDP